MINKENFQIDASLKFQKDRYDKEASDYYLTHGDYYSQKYRDVFIRNYAFPFDLNGKKVLDAMCAFGAETGFLLERGAIVEGLDISEENTNLYKKLWQLNCQTKSINNTGYQNNSFDVVYICGGLHHILPLLEETMNEIHRILKPGGFFCFVEPNASTWVNYLRNLWYKIDKKFTESEEAICYESKLKPFLNIGFKEKSIHYGGGIAYLLIAQSLIMRTPYCIKKGFHKPLFFLEKFMQIINFSPKLFFVSVWEKE